MSRARFLADHDLNEHIVLGVLRREPALTFLRARGVGISDQPDAALVDHAAREGLIAVSHDFNTMPAEAYARVKAGKPLAGLLMVKQSEAVGLVIDDIVAIWSATEAEEWNNLVCFLPLS